MIEVESLEELERLRVMWKHDALRQISKNIVEILAADGVPRERLAELAEPGVVKAYRMIAAHIDSHAARIEREILNASQH